MDGWVHMLARFCSMDQSSIDDWTYLGHVRVQPHAQERVHGLDAGLEALEESHVWSLLCGWCGVGGWVAWS